MNVWTELRLQRGADLLKFYEWLKIKDEWIISSHHFWDEPWWPGAYVVRVQSVGGVGYEACPEVDHLEPWDSTPDEELFADHWGHAKRFFEASSAMSSDPDLTGKLVHCLLNARGMSRWGEVKFVLSYIWRSLTISIRWRLYLRRQWEREQRRRAEACA